MNPKCTDLLGAWRLIEFTVTGPHGERRPFDRGMLVYGAERMSAMLSRTLPAGSGSLETAHRLSEAEKVAAFDATLAYAGRWEIQGDEVLHHVEMSLSPGVAGTTQRRRFVLDGDRLSLCYELQGRSGMHRFRLEWER